MYALRSARGLRSIPRPVRLNRLQNRQFHPTKPTQSLIDVALTGSTAIIHGVHTVSGLPWAASIPLTAVLVRCFFGFPIQLYSRLRSQQAIQLQPVLTAWGRVYENATRREAPNNPQEATRLTKEKLKLRTKVMNRAWGVSFFKHPPVGLLQIPVFLSFMEGLRGMSGVDKGLFAWLKTILTSFDSASAAGTLGPLLEPSFATEGALWFPDLLAGDQTGILPFILSASILGNVIAGWKAKSFPEISELPKFLMYQQLTFRGLRFFVQGLAIHVGIMGFVSQLPTALMLYWITSTNIATLQSWILDKKVFARQQLKPFEKRYVAFEKPGDDDPFQLKNLR